MAFSQGDTSLHFELFQIEGKSLITTGHDINLGSYHIRFDKRTLRASNDRGTNFINNFISCKETDTVEQFSWIDMAVAYCMYYTQPTDQLGELMVTFDTLGIECRDENRSPTGKSEFEMVLTVIVAIIHSNGSLDCFRNKKNVVNFFDPSHSSKACQGIPGYLKNNPVMYTAATKMSDTCSAEINEDLFKFLFTKAVYMMLFSKVSSTTVQRVALSGTGWKILGLHRIIDSRASDSLHIFLASKYMLENANHELNFLAGPPRAKGHFSLDFLSASPHNVMYNGSGTMYATAALLLSVLAIDADPSGFFLTVLGSRAPARLIGNIWLRLATIRTDSDVDTLKLDLTFKAHALESASSSYPIDFATINLTSVVEWREKIIKRIDTCDTLCALIAPCISKFNVIFKYSIAKMNMSIDSTVSLTAAITLSPDTCFEIFGVTNTLGAHRKIGEARTVVAPQAREPEVVDGGDDGAFNDLDPVVEVA